MSKVIRSFLAFELPGEMKEIVKRVHAELTKSALDVKWMRPGNVHLTVVFLGNVSTQDLAPLGTEVSKVCSKYGRFEVELKGMGIFGGLRSPRVLWIGLGGDLERMGFFRDAISKRLRRFGIRQEKRPFRPHLTLGRFRKGAKGGLHLKDILDRYVGLTSPRQPLRELTLFRSDLRPEGAHYTKIESWPLEGNK